MPQHPTRIAVTTRNAVTAAGTSVTTTSNQIEVITLLAPSRQRSEAAIR